MSGLYDFIEMSQHLPLVYLAIGLYLAHWILSHPNEWQAFLASFDTNGGHIALLVGALAVGYRLFQSDATAGGQLITGAWAALLVLLNAKRPTRTGDPPLDATTSQTTTVVASTSATIPPAAQQVHE